ncbi:MAG: methyl-accepting chemotaxis protein [Phenylobacterium sp.]|uniref:methyl-accepting chemotaxis protein n=1 Tax=Phenylobacterium sp. TaxID=1871053 RepID=UPI0027351DF4|nr:methyl-accepting chemotaxis protein [Phenylobacterium sp.]MDP3746923.1 methyl-accepting chemotaxis protein [Phenylobacterium sp.]
MASADAGLVPERILELSERLSAVAGGKIGEISAINRQAKMLAINALITAARAGEAGKGFAIVAEEFKRIAAEIDEVAGAMESQVRADLAELSAVGAAILSHLRGQRVADLALNAIEIIDRNLYERTCDVRWWATDSAVVACVADPSEAASRFASDRLKVILDAYTVYLDLWICDAKGKVVATGRPQRYRPRSGSMSRASPGSSGPFAPARATSSWPATWSGPRRWRTPRSPPTPPPFAGRAVPTGRCSACWASTSTGAHRPTRWSTACG